MTEIAIGVGVVVGGLAGLIGLLVFVSRFNGLLAVLGFPMTLVGACAIVGHEITHGGHVEPPLWMLIVGGAGAVLLLLGAIGASLEDPYL